jgi:hypothetical protein
MTGFQYFQSGILFFRLGATTAIRCHNWVVGILHSVPETIIRSSKLPVINVWSLLYRREDRLPG